MTYAINGKFISQTVTGVQRVAYELTRAMQVHEGLAGQMDIFVPENVKDPGRQLRRLRRFAWLRGTLWEQITLPIAARGRTLINLCNTNPILKRRQVVMLHDMSIYNVPQGFSKKFLIWYRLCFGILPKMQPLILTVSAFSKGRICHHLKVDESRVAVITPAADHLDRIVADGAVIDRLKLIEDAYCLIVGTLDPRKNLQRVLDAIDKLQGLKDIRFVIVGGKNPRIFNGNGVSEAPVSDQVTWAGFVTDNELKALYEKAGCLIFPSLYEGFGLPPLEAMYCGCPVIASTRTSLPEVCGDAALYCDVTSVDDIASKIGQMMSDSHLRERYRIEGVEHARKYRWDRSAQRLLYILERAQRAGQSDARATRWSV